jgi:Xaa-Pro aminopeptidase
MVFKDRNRARLESAIKQMVPINGLTDIPKKIKQRFHQLPKTLGLELDVLPANNYLGYGQSFQHPDIIDISPFIRHIRAIKSDYEIEMIRQAAIRSDQVAEGIKELVYEGITEIELAGKVEAKARKLGHQGIVRMRMWGNELFYGHLMAGPTAAQPSYLSSPTGGSGVGQAIAQGPSFRRIKRHEPILVDYVFVYNGYLSDHTRIFSIGQLPDNLMKGHEAMLNLQNVIKSVAKPDVEAGEIYTLATDFVRSRGLEDYFMGADDQRIRFVGHGVGLELDEFPFLAKGQKIRLQKGMTVALEPKLIFPGQGVVGIENTHVVTESGLKQLSCFEQEVIVL